MPNPCYYGFSNDSLISLSQVKARTGLSHTKVKKLTEAGVFGHVHQIGEELRYWRSDVDDWIDEQIARDHSELQRRAYAQIIAKAVGWQEIPARYLAVNLRLKTGILLPTGRRMFLNRSEVSQQITELLAAFGPVVDEQCGQKEAWKPLCFPVLSHSEGTWRIDFLLEVPHMADGMDFVEQVMTLWCQNVWSTEDWEVEEIRGQDQVLKWFRESLKNVLVDDETVDQTNLHVPRNSLYALSPATIVDPASWQ
jgi:predicted DNA-binding transcriptional regulator AlpA